MAVDARRRHGCVALANEAMLQRPSCGGDAAARRWRMRQRSGDRPEWRPVQGDTAWCVGLVRRPRQCAGGVSVAPARWATRQRWRRTGATRQGRWLWCTGDVASTTAIATSVLPVPSSSDSASVTAAGYEEVAGNWRRSGRPICRLVVDAVVRRGGSTRDDNAWRGLMSKVLAWSWPAKFGSWCAVGARALLLCTRQRRASMVGDGVGLVARVLLLHPAWEGCLVRCEENWCEAPGQGWELVQ